MATGQFCSRIKAAIYGEASIGFSITHIESHLLKFVDCSGLFCHMSYR